MTDNDADSLQPFKVVYIVPFIVVASIMLFVLLAACGRKIYNQNRFHRYQVPLQPRYDLPNYRVAGQEAFREPYYPVLPYDLPSAAQPSHPPPATTTMPLAHLRGAPYAPMIVPLSRAPSITPYVSSVRAEPRDYEVGEYESVMATRDQSRMGARSEVRSEDDDMGTVETGLPGYESATGHGGRSWR